MTAVPKGKTHMLQSPRPAGNLSWDKAPYAVFLRSTKTVASRAAVSP